MDVPEGCRVKEQRATSAAALNEGRVGGRVEGRVGERERAHPRRPGRHQALPLGTPPVGWAGSSDKRSHTMGKRAPSRSPSRSPSGALRASTGTEANSETTRGTGSAVGPASSGGLASVGNALCAAAAVRIALLCFGLWQDANMPVRCDATRHFPLPQSFPHSKLTRRCAQVH